MNGTTTAATISVAIRSLKVSLRMIFTSFPDPTIREITGPVLGA
jgi:hypothetical protein